MADVPFSHNQQNYTILMIVTDGVITDMQKTIDAIVNAGDKPLSIIIVGVGNADFENMDILDADDPPLRSSRGKLMPRDIVQFVPYNQFKRNPGQLSKETLQEVPTQVTELMRMKKAKPMAVNKGSFRVLPG